MTVYNERGFMLLYSMLFILCISGFSMYLIHHYEMERKLTAYELEDTYTQQLIMYGAAYLIEEAEKEKKENLYLSKKAERGKVTGRGEKQEQHWKMEASAESGEFRRNVHFYYHEGTIFDWEESS